jgi:hypothetical protein
MPSLRLAVLARSMITYSTNLVRYKWPASVICIPVKSGGNGGYMDWPYNISVLLSIGEMLQKGK